MNYTTIKKLPTAEAFFEALPLSYTTRKKIMRDRQEIKSILEGQDRRLLIIVGPCSAWPKIAVFDYAERLTALQKKVSHALKIVMRVYTEKPRTITGWTGPVNQPDIFAHPDILEGMYYTRQMMMRVIEMGLPIANEVLFTHNTKVFLELVSWAAIGARSVENQEHRIIASALNCAVGMKNPTHGSLAVGVNSVVAAQHPHVAVFDGYEIQSHGNPYAHLVLRGANQIPNYSIEHLKEVLQHMTVQNLQYPSVIVDASHDNCMVDGKKDPELQPNIIFDILQDIAPHPHLKSLVKGFMMESFIKNGNQTVDLDNPDSIDLSGLSITDPCLGWEQTEYFLRTLAEMHHASSTC